MSLLRNGPFSLIFDYFLFAFTHPVNTKHLCTEKTPDCRTHRPYWRKDKLHFLLSYLLCFFCSVGNARVLSPMCILFFLFFCFCFIYFMRERIALCFSLRQWKSVHWNWKSKISCATCKDATHHCKTTAVFLKSIWCVETKKKKKLLCFLLFPVLTHFFHMHTCCCILSPCLEALSSWPTREIQGAVSCNNPHNAFTAVHGWSSSDMWTG